MRAFGGGCSYFLSMLLWLISALTWLRGQVERGLALQWYSVSSRESGIDIESQSFANNDIMDQMAEITKMGDGGESAWKFVLVLLVREQRGPFRR